MKITIYTQTAAKFSEGMNRGAASGSSILWLTFKWLRDLRRWIASFRKLWICFGIHERISHVVYSLAYTSYSQSTQTSLVIELYIRLTHCKQRYTVRTQINRKEKGNHPRCYYLIFYLFAFARNIRAKVSFHALSHESQSEARLSRQVLIYRCFKPSTFACFSAIRDRAKNACSTLTMRLNTPSILPRDEQRSIEVDRSCTWIHPLMNVAVIFYAVDLSKLSIPKPS